MSTPPTSILPKIFALGGAAIGGLLLRDRYVHEKGLLKKQFYDTMREDYLSHSREAFFDYSGNETLTNIKHKLFNPQNTHFIRLPWIYVKGFARLVKDNLIPLGLMLVGLTYAFNGSLLGVFGKAGQGVATLGKTGGSILGTVSKALAGVAYSGAKSLFGNMPSFAKLTPKSILAVVSAMSLGMYALHRFKRELTGENRSDFFDGLKPPK